MSNSDVFGSPMILTGYRPVSPFGAALYKNSGKTTAAGAAGVAAIGRRLLQVLRGVFPGKSRERPHERPRERRVRHTVAALSQLDDRTLRDIGLDRGAVLSSARHDAARRGVDGRRVTGRFRT